MLVDAGNRLQAFHPPESEAAGEDNVIKPAWSFSDSGKIPGGGLLTKYSTSPVSNGTSVFWVCGQSSYLWGVDTSTAQPAPVSWAPLNLVTASGNNHFKDFTAETQLLYHDQHVWVPAADEHVAMSVDAKTGEHKNTTEPAQNGHRLLGMVGTTADSGHSVAILSTVDHMSSFNNVAKRLWIAKVAFSQVAQESTHPVMIEYRVGATRCIIMSRVQNGGLYIVGVSPETGEACASWKQAGYTIRTKYTWSPSWVSAPAVIQDFNRFYLYYNINLPDEATGRAGHRSATIQIEIDKYGPVGTDQVLDGHIFNGVRMNMAPVAFLNAYGANKHAIAVVSDNGAVYIFDHMVLTKVKYSFAAKTVLTMPRTTTDGWLQTAGNYAAASQAGSLFFVAYDTISRESFLVSVSRAINGPESVKPSPSPPAAPTGNSPSGAQIAAGVFGGLGGLAVACAAVVFCLPTYQFKLGSTDVHPAGIIKGGAQSVYYGVSSLLPTGGNRGSLTKNPYSTISSTTAADTSHPIFTKSRTMSGSAPSTSYGGTSSGYSNA